ncbi:MAG: hypothetical protein Q7K57_14810 [Burkholderiaceae bacterium]|nr:hypothetical protein [Burkholderiaceae bacterium]
MHTPINGPMRRSIRVAVVLCAALVLGSCANSAKNVPARYVAPDRYQAYNCAQLTVEFQRVQGRIVQLGGRLDEVASKDTLMGVFGAVVFFPALWKLGGNEQQEAEYGDLKGEAEAMHQAAFMKRCASLVAPDSSNP